MILVVQATEGVDRGLVLSGDLRAGAGGGGLEKKNQYTKPARQREGRGVAETPGEPGGRRTRPTARSMARGAAGGLGGLEGGDFDLAPAAGTHHLVASLRGKWGAGCARVRHRVLNCRMPACLESGRQASWFKKKKMGEFCRKSFPESLPGGPSELSGAPARVILNVASRTATACATEDVAGGGGGAVVNGFSFFFGKFRERERTPAEAEAPVVQLVRWCTRSSVYLFGLVLIFFFVVTSP